MTIKIEQKFYLAHSFAAAEASRPFVCIVAFVDEAALDGRARCAPAEEARRSDKL